LKINFEFISFGVVNRITIEKVEKEEMKLKNLEKTLEEIKEIIKKKIK
jgi:hypothetical protein